MKALAIIANFFIPGLGSLFINHYWQGALQLLLYVIGIMTAFFLIGFVFILIAWIWGLVTAIQYQDKPMTIVVQQQTQQQEK